MSQNDENNFFRPVMRWATTEEGWSLKTSAKPAECIKQGTACSRLRSKDAKRNCTQLHHKLFSTLWERKRWLSLFINNLRCRVTDPHPKSLTNTTLWNIHSRFYANTNNSISQEWRSIIYTARICVDSKMHNKLEPNLLRGKAKL